MKVNLKIRGKDVNTIKVVGKDTKFIAHRGLSVLERENTHAAFIAAGCKSYYASECDIHLTKDNHFVVIHDFSTRRVAEVDKLVKDSTLAELRDIQLYDLDDQVKTHLRIPTLEEYIGISKKYSMKCFIEIKPVMNLPQIKNLLSVIESYDYLDEVCIISFDYQNLENVRILNKEIELGFLVNEYKNDLLDGCYKINAFLNINYQVVTEDLIKTFHNHNLKIGTWTVDDEEVAKELVGYRIDYITSNNLEGI